MEYLTIGGKSVYDTKFNYLKECNYLVITGIDDCWDKGNQFSSGI